MPSEPEAPTKLGRYVLYSELASGGMARVHLGRMFAPGGFSKTVAIKRLHPHLARDPAFVTMFLDEARLAARISHPNVVSTDDVVAENGELFLVMEYVQGETLARLLRAAHERGEHVPWRVVCAIAASVLSGLHAAHEARSQSGVALDIVHRDVSPQNVMVGEDGIARVLDFGVAKATQRLYGSTESGAVKGKFAYMSPEQVSGLPVDRRCDVFAAGIVTWEALTGERLFDGDTGAAIVAAILAGKIRAPRELRADAPPELDAIVSKALATDPAARYATAEAMAIAIEAVGMATPREVAAWVRGLAGDALDVRAKKVAEIESGPERLGPIALGDDGMKTAVAKGNQTLFEEGKTELASAPGIARTSRLPVVLGVVALAAIATGGVYAFARRTTPDVPAVSAASASANATSAPSASETSAPAPSIASATPSASSPRPRPARVRTPPRASSSAPRVPGLEKEM
ncbi:MAG TPA: serine/threonine-protein kinase [Labilithrix sp.]